MLGGYWTPAAAATAAAAASGGQLDAGRLVLQTTVIVSGDTYAGRPVLISRSSSRRRSRRRRKKTPKRATSRLAADNNTYRQPSRAEPSRTEPGRARCRSSLLSARCRQRLLLTEHSTRSSARPSIIHVHPPAVPPRLHSRYSLATLSSCHTACY